MLCVDIPWHTSGRGGSHSGTCDNIGKIDEARLEDALDSGCGGSADMVEIAMDFKSHIVYYHRWHCRLSVAAPSGTQVVDGSH